VIDINTIITDKVVCNVSSLLIDDIDGDGINEIVIGTNDGEVYCYTFEYAVHGTDSGKIEIPDRVQEPAVEQPHVQPVETETPIKLYTYAIITGILIRMINLMKLYCGGKNTPITSLTRTSSNSDLSYFLITEEGKLTEIYKSNEFKQIDAAIKELSKVCKVVVHLITRSLDPIGHQ
jgi:hypothetical protein